MVAEGLAYYLHGLGLLTYTPGVVGGNASLNAMPAEPDTWTGLFSYPAPPSDAWLGYDMEAVQVRVRGGADSRPVEVRAKAYYNALHGVHHVTLQDGTLLLNCIAQQAPFSLGLDDTGTRHEWAFNVYCEVRNATTRE